MTDPRRLRFERLTLPLEKALYYAARTLTSHEADALDLVQETYLRAYRAFDTYKTNENIRGWMVTILRHVYLDHCRRKKLEPVLQDLAHCPLESPPPTAATSLDAVLPDELLRALRTLSPTAQLLVQLADIDRLSYKEIATALDIPIGSVMSGLFNARSRLRIALERQMPHR